MKRPILITVFISLHLSVAVMSTSFKAYDPIAKRVRTLIYDMRLEHPDIVYAQAVLESNNFKSTIFRENNNMFGMKRAGSRPTTCIGVNRGHAVYESIESSIIDYALFQSAYMRKLSRKEYLAKLSRSYAEDKSYINKLIQITKHESKN